MQFGWKLKHDSAPYYHKRTKLITNQLIVSLPPWLKVSLSPNLSSGPSSVLALLCPLMKSLDTHQWSDHKIHDIIISRKREVSMSQSANNKPFTDHFKMRTFRYDLPLNCFVTLTDLCYEVSFQHSWPFRPPFLSLPTPCHFYLSEKIKTTWVSPTAMVNHLFFLLNLQLDLQ